jgi:MFS family permease
MRVVGGVLESLRAFGAVFRNPNLRRLQLAGAGSTLGTWAYGVAIAVYAYHAGGAKAVGILYAVRWGIGGIAAPWFAVLADRTSRRRTMLAADLVRFALLAAIAALAFADGSWIVVFVLAVAATAASSAFHPAEAALLPSLVETPEELTAANAVMNSISSIGMFLGPALAGILLAASGTGAVFAMTAATFIWSALFLVRIPPDARPEAAEDSTRGGEIVAGFRAIASTGPLRLVVGITAAQMLVTGALEVLIVVLALRVLHGGNGAVGWLNTAMGVGCLIGVVVVAALVGRKRLAGDLAIGAVVFGAPIALAAVWTNLGFAVVLFALIGIGTTVVDVAGMTLMQRSAEEAVLARVFGVLESAILGTLAVGALVAPLLVAGLGPRGALIATGAVIPAVVVLALPALRRVDDAARIAEEPLELLRRLPLFAPLPPTVLERLAAAAVDLHMQPMAEVITQGARGDWFYVIRSGRATVEVDGVETGELGPGDFFGEIALLRDVPRTATVRALEPLELFGLERDDFLAAVTGHAPSRAAADSIVAARLPAGAAL